MLVWDMRRVIINSNNWFYKCNNCDSTLHTKCVFQNLILSRSGFSITVGDMAQLDFVLNTRLSRPICFGRKTRCTEDLFLACEFESIKLFICYSCSLEFFHGTLSIDLKGTWYECMPHDHEQC